MACGEGFGMAPTVLLIDDDLPTVQRLQPALAEAGYQVDHALPGMLAVRRILVEQPDLVILGISQHDLDWHFCRRLLTFLDQPLLLLLASGRPRDQARGLNLGADDCMVKPVRQVELVARVRSLLRRDVYGALRSQRDFFVDGELVVDLTRQEVRLHDQPVALTPTEFRLLACLVRHVGQVVPHEELMADVWGPNPVDRRHALKGYIHTLRQKLRDDPGRPQRILTRWGQGYMLQPLAPV